MEKLNLKKQKCFNHGEREAVAMCLQCHRHFCRECVTKHDERLLCNNCLSKIIEEKKKKKVNFSFLKLIILYFATFISLILVFFTVYICLNQSIKSQLDLPSQINTVEEDK
ncbi:rhomboid family protein [Lentisphaerota bacterium WC36G]|nr:rhomboid family protein [Lentisphaerae bacterium WC36]